jgi:hypothetical protein
MMTDRTMRALVVAMFVGAAVAGGAVLSQPAPAGAADSDALAGVWDGMIRGEDLANASGPTTAPAHLVITEDGRWTMTTMGQTESGTVRRSGNRLVLDGTVISGDPMAAGRTVSYVLSRRGEDLYGSGDVFVLGHRASAALSLDRLSNAPSPASPRSQSVR